MTRGHCYAERGLTLLELLLTLVIFSLVIAIFSQALFQIGQFSQAASRAGDRWQQGWSSGFALDSYFASLRFPDQPGSQRSEGTDNELTVWWIAQSSSREGLPVRAHLVLRPLATSDTSRGNANESWGLFVSEDDGVEALFARWPHPVSFQYLNSGGELHAAWPQPLQGLTSVRLETLPRAVRVVDGRGAIAHAWTFGGLTQPGLAPNVQPFMPGGAAPPR